MDIRDGFIGSIGNTPLIWLRGPSELTGCEILGKAEFLNPGGVVVEGTAGGLPMMLFRGHQAPLKLRQAAREGPARISRPRMKHSLVRAWPSG